jgi:O-methyltransferase
MRTMEHLIGVNLGRPARAVKRRLHPLFARNGLAPWEPLVPTSAFTRCMGDAVAELLDGRTTNDPFTYLEFGVSRGTSLACVDEVLRSAGVDGTRIVGFDSFAGLPSEAEFEGWLPGAYRSNLWATKRYLREHGVDLGRVHLVKGWFDDTLTPATRSGLGIDRADLIMVDCDIYSASRKALEFALPLVGDRAIVVFDDWGWREDAGERGQKEAFEEVLAEHPTLVAEERPSYLPQARLFCLVRRA